MKESSESQREDQYTSIGSSSVLDIVFIIITGKGELNRIHINGCRCNQGCNERLIVKTEGSHALGCTGRKNRKSSIGSHGHTGGTRPDQTRKTTKNLSEHDREERGCGEGVGLYVVYMCERGGGGRGGCGFRSVISDIIHT
jgi:hypothetical protein